MRCRLEWCVRHDLLISCGLFTQNWHATRHKRTLNATRAADDSTNWTNSNALTDRRSKSSFRKMKKVSRSSTRQLAHTFGQPNWSCRKTSCSEEDVSREGAVRRPLLRCQDATPPPQSSSSPLFCIRPGALALARHLNILQSGWTGGQHRVLPERDVRRTAKRAATRQRILSLPRAPHAVLVAVSL